MYTTRSTHLLRRLVGFAAVPALLLTAAACGDDDDSAGSSGSFCEKAKQLDEEFADSNPDAYDRQLEVPWFLLIGASKP